MKPIVKALVSLSSAKKFNLEQSKVLSINKDLNITYLSEREKLLCITLYAEIDQINKHFVILREKEGGQKMRERKRGREMERERMRVCLRETDRQTDRQTDRRRERLYHVGHFANNLVVTDYVQYV